MRLERQIQICGLNSIVTIMELVLLAIQGDLLVIWAKPEDEVGIFTASLQWSIKDMYAFTSLGQCSLER